LEFGGILGVIGKLLVSQILIEFISPFSELRYFTIFFINPFKNNNCGFQKIGILN
jgi:hypothetical protein